MIQETFRGRLAMDKVADLVRGCNLVTRDELRTMAIASAALGLDPEDARPVLRLAGVPFNDDDVQDLEELIREER